MDAMESRATTGERSQRTTLYRWAVFALVVTAATMLFGWLALIILLMVAGVLLIISGIRATGWPRPVLIGIGTLLVLAPMALLIDMVTGSIVLVVE